MADFVIEEMPDGRTLVVTGPWSRAVEQILMRGDVDGVWLNYARGFEAKDLSFIGEWPVRRLRLIERSLDDLGPLSRLGETLEDLSVQAAPGATVDLAALPNLRRVAAPWETVRETLHGPECLAEISAFDYDESDLAPLAVQPSLQVITLKTAPALQSLAGIESLPTLTTLRVAAARHLSELDPVETASLTLRELDMEACGAVDVLDAVSNLEQLQFLGVNDCETIASLAPLRDLAQLVTLHAWGSTRVADQDLSPLLRLTLLGEIRMRDRPQYRPRLSAVKAQLGCS